eukprot:4064-Pleurochrysis_carterae.AAC.1
MPRHTPRLRTALMPSHGTRLSRRIALAFRTHLALVLAHCCVAACSALCAVGAHRLYFSPVPQRTSPPRAALIFCVRLRLFPMGMSNSGTRALLLSRAICCMLHRAHCTLSPQPTSRLHAPLEFC